MHSEDPDLFITTGFEKRARAPGGDGHKGLPRTNKQDVDKTILEYTLSKDSLIHFSE